MAGLEVHRIPSIWSRWSGSNGRPHAPKASALPTAPHRVLNWLPVWLTEHGGERSLKRAALLQRFPVTGSGAAQSLRPISTPGRACATEGFGSHCGCAPARVRIHSAQRCLAARCGRPRSAHAGRPCAFRGMHSTVVLKHTRNEMLGRIRECHSVGHCTGSAWMRARLAPSRAGGSRQIVKERPEARCARHVPVEHVCDR